MSGAAAVLAATQVLAGAMAAPALPGLIQSMKARLQGRRGTSPLQPYRELRRLWAKSTVEPEGTTFIYRGAPAMVASAALCCLMIIAPAGVTSAGPLGHDVLLVVGLLALARYSIAASTWDTSGAFGLMAAARDLTLALSAEAVLLLSLVVAALPARSTDLRAMSAASAGGDVWLTPAHWCAMIAFALVMVAETGRQPIDNPDTHLELTMIHEGPLLEYAGRDLAFLQWASAARHWIVLTLAIEIFLPHGGDAAARIAEFVAGMTFLGAGLALTETLVAKMRLLRVPAFLGSGAALAIIGLSSWLLVPAK